MSLRGTVAGIRDRLPIPVRFGSWRNAREQVNALGCLVQAHARPPYQGGAVSKIAYSGVVFSKDRALQIHGLLCSWIRHVAPPRPPLVILYRTTSPAHEKAYVEMRQSLGSVLSEEDIRMVPETPAGFQTQFVAGLESIRACRVFCLTDDDLFIRPSSFSDFDAFDLRQCVPSLRLGRGINHAYMNSQEHAMPALTATSVAGLVSWSWATGAGAWTYPMSLDGNIFDRDEFLSMARFLRYCGPNSLEREMSRAFGRLFSLRRGICFEQPRLVNAPWNCVQNEIVNRCGQLSTDKLLMRWQNGECLDVRAYDNLVANATHVEITPQFTRRSRIF